MIDPAALRRRASPIDRSSDRLVALGAIALAVAFLVASVVAMFLPVAVRRGAWLPLHLALAGAATTAIAGVMPFFAAAFAAAPPSDARLRTAAVGTVALGAAAVSVGVVGGEVGLAVAGGIGFVAGIALTAIATVRPLGRALGPSRGLVTQGYVIALGEVAVGASLATLFVAGWPPIVEDWARVKPAHAWLNLVGFVSLVIATTLLHFFPTVVGARIALRPSARITVAGLAAGAPLVALGFAVSSDLIARIGAVGVIGGAMGLAVYAWRTWQTKARWTTDPGWHRFAIGGLVSAIVWFEIGMAVAAGQVLVFGADPAELVGRGGRRSARRRLDRAGDRRIGDAPAAGGRSGRSCRPRAAATAPRASGHGPAGGPQRRRRGAGDRPAPRGWDAGDDRGRPRRARSRYHRRAAWNCCSDGSPSTADLTASRRRAARAALSMSSSAQAG